MSRATQICASGKMMRLLCSLCAVIPPAVGQIEFICKNVKASANINEGLPRYAGLTRHDRQNWGRMFYSKYIVCSAFALAGAAQAQQETLMAAPDASSTVAVEQSVPAEASPAIAFKSLPAGTPVFVSLDAELSTQSSKLGDGFFVTVVNDVTQDGVVMIPKGAKGRGEVTFVTKKGSFGKPGIIGIALRDLDLNGRTVLLDGRFREEGGNNNAATAATWFAVGIGSVLIKGKSSVIPAGRELKGRTGEDISVMPAAPEPSVQSAPAVEMTATEQAPVVEQAPPSP
jgi:hypothetical protein